METRMYQVTICGQTREYPEGTAYGEIVKEFESQSEYPVVLVMVDKRLRELHKRLKKDCSISLVSIADGIGHKTYKRSMNLLLLKSIYNVAGHENIEKIVLHFTVGEGYYYTVKGNIAIDREFLDRVETDGSSSIWYIHEDGSIILLVSAFGTDKNTFFLVPAEHDVYSQENIEGTMMEFYLSPDPECNSVVLWTNDDHVMFSINAICDKDTLIELAQSVYEIK